MMVSFRQKLGRVSGRVLQTALSCLLVFICLHAGCRQPNTSSAVKTPPSAQTQNSPRPDADSRAGNVRTEIGFATRQKFVDHYEKHGAEFGSISREEYLRRAQELRDRPAGGDVLEIKRADGVITRFDRTSGDFLAFNPDLTIRTFFKPNDGERYFQRQSRR